MDLRASGDMRQDRRWKHCANDRVEHGAKQLGVMVLPGYRVRNRRESLRQRVAKNASMHFKILKFAVAIVAVLCFVIATAELSSASGDPSATPAPTDSLSIGGAAIKVENRAR